MRVAVGGTEVGRLLFLHGPADRLVVVYGDGGAANGESSPLLSVHHLSFIAGRARVSVCDNVCFWLMIGE